MLQELERISERGGVLGAMESQYQRGKIQNESMLYEMKKHHGELPIIGVNTFLHPNPSKDEDMNIPLARATIGRKRAANYESQGVSCETPSRITAALAKLQQIALDGGNIFDRIDGNGQGSKLGANYPRALSGRRAISQKYVAAGERRSSYVFSANYQASTAWFNR